MKKSDIEELAQLTKVLEGTRAIINTSGFSRFSKQQIHQARERQTELETVFMNRLLALETGESKPAVKKTVPINESAVEALTVDSAVVVAPKSSQPGIEMTTQVNQLDPEVETGHMVVAAPMKVMESAKKATKKKGIRRSDAD